MRDYLRCGMRIWLLRLPQKRPMVKLVDLWTWPMLEYIGKLKQVHWVQNGVLCKSKTDVWPLVWLGKLLSNLCSNTHLILTWKTQPYLLTDHPFLIDSQINHCIQDQLSVSSCSKNAKETKSTIVFTLLTTAVRSRSSTVGWYSVFLQSFFNYSSIR